jgi:hypothetical protein
VARLFWTHLPEQNIDTPAQRGANRIAEPSLSRASSLALSFGWARRYAQIRSWSSTVNSEFGLRLWFAGEGAKLLHASLEIGLVFGRSHLSGFGHVIRSFSSSHMMARTRATDDAGHHYRQAGRRAAASNGRLRTIGWEIMAP